jgi:hypothetical protein
MDRKNNLRAFERGVRAMLAEGLRVKVDLIIGLPGDTVESVRRGLHYLHDNGLYSDLQVFTLGVLPGTEFRHEASALGLTHQARPPYYVLRTPTLCLEQMFALMQEAQELFGIDFDAPSPPVLTFDETNGLERVWRVNLDKGAGQPMPSPDRWAQAFTLWLTARDFTTTRPAAEKLIEQVLTACPFTTLQVVLEPAEVTTAAEVRRSLAPATVEALWSACQARPTYLDRYYAVQPGPPNGAKRVVVAVPERLRAEMGREWVDGMAGSGAVVWREIGTTACGQSSSWSCLPS